MCSIFWILFELEPNYTPFPSPTVNICAQSFGYCLNWNQITHLFHHQLLLFWLFTGTKLYNLTTEAQLAAGCTASQPGIILVNLACEFDTISCGTGWSTGNVHWSNCNCCVMYSDIEMFCERFCRALTFVYPFGATLNVAKPAVAVLSSGSVSYPLNRPVCAFYGLKVISLSW